MMKKIQDKIEKYKNSVCVQDWDYESLKHSFSLIVS